MYLDSSSREEQPVGSVGGVQGVLQEGGPVGSVDQQHVVKPPTGLISFRALGGLLSPAETHAVGLGVMWQGQQVDDGAAVRRGSGGGEGHNMGVLVKCGSLCIEISKTVGDTDGDGEKRLVSVSKQELTAAK